MEEKIFILIKGEFRKGFASINTYLYKNIEQAQKHLQMIKNNFETTHDLNNYIIDTDNDNEFFAHLNGRYQDDHIDIWIEEKGIN